jgi:hypothetical protein
MTIGKIFKLPLIGRKAVSLSFVDDRHGSATRAVQVTGQGNFETKLMAKVIHGAEYKQRTELVDGEERLVFDDMNRPVMDMIPGTGYEKPIYEYFGNRKQGNSLYARIYNKLQMLYYRGLYRNKTELDLGSGLITNVSQLALANDFNWPNPATAINTLKICNYHATGTGTTPAAATDIQLQTADSITPVAGAQSLVSAANLQKLQTVATLAYTGTEAVTEWGLFAASTLSSTTGTPLTASSATGGTVTGTPLTASASNVQGQTQKIVVDTTASPNVCGLVTSNTTSQFTVPAWYKKSDGTAGSTPGSTDAIAWYPTILDHKVFSAINVVNGDSIQFSYLCTMATGG